MIFKVHRQLDIFGAFKIRECLCDTCQGWISGDTGKVNDENSMKRLKFIIFVIF